MLMQLPDVSEVPACHIGQEEDHISDVIMSSLSGIAHDFRDYVPGRQNRLMISHIARSDMIHPKIVRDGPMTTGGPDPLKDALALQIRVRGLQALLELQRWQIEVLNNRLYSSQPGGVAARRLLAIKRSETQVARLKVPKGVNDP